MTPSTSQPRLVLVVDTDAGFAGFAGAILSSDRILAARTIEEAAEILTDEPVDLALLGPSFGTARGVASAGLLRDVDPCLRAVLVAEIVTNRILLASLRSGLVDVVDTPLTETKLKGILDRLVPPDREPAGTFRIDQESTVVALTGHPDLVESDQPEAWSSVATPASFTESEIHIEAWPASAVSGPVEPSTDIRRPRPIPVQSLDFTVERWEEEAEDDELPRTGEARA